MNKKPTLEREIQHMDELLANRLKGYSQPPPDHLWLLIESKLELENDEKSNSNLLHKLLMKFRITLS